MRSRRSTSGKSAALEGRGSNTTTTVDSRTEGVLKSLASALGLGEDFNLTSPRTQAFERLDLETARKYRSPFALQEAMASGLLQQLQQNPAWMARVTAANPRLGQLLSKLANAARWSLEWEHAEQWLAFVNRERAAGWDVALEALDELRHTAAFVSTWDPTFDPALPMLAAFFEVREQIAVKAAEARRANAAKGEQTGEQKPDAKPGDSKPTPSQ